MRKTLSQQAAEEQKKLRQLLFDCGAPGDRVVLMESVIENTAWMRVKLDEARQAIAESTVAIPYDNGGGQKGLRENPLFKGYSSLWKSYISGLDKLMAIIPPADARVPENMPEEPKTVLEIVRAKKRSAG